MNSEQRLRIFNIIKKELCIDPSGIDLNADLREMSLLDSMEFVAIVARIEMDMDIELPIHIIDVKTLNEFLDVIEKQLKVER